MACVALILLIACTNVANLLLARTADRAAEFSIRSALGASRARIVQQLLTECVLLSVAASVLGLGVAWLATEVAARFQPVATVSQAYSLLEGRVLAFAILLSMVSAVLFGLLPSFYAGRVHAFGTRSSNETRSRRLIREVLVAAQVMLTIVLVAASMSAGQAFVKLVSFDRGYETRGLATASVSLDGTIYDSNAQRFAYFQQVLDRLRRLPGVVSASATGFLPLDAKGFIGGRPSLDGRQAHQNSMVVPIFADYFRTMGGRILAGREFTEAEVHSGARVAMVNEAFANEFGSPRDVLDHEIGIGRNARWKVLGVVRGMDYMVDGANAYEMFIPSNSGGSTFVARVSGRAADRLAMIRDSIRSVDRQVPLFGVRTMEDRLDEALARPEFYRTSVLCFAVFALLLAVVGIYGIVSYAVARRTHEMGVRMALGVTSGQLRMSVLRQGVTTVLVGSAMGVAGSIMGGRVLENLMVGAKPVEAAGYTAAVGLIVSIAAAGIWMATRPITRLDIVEILRRE
jgi:putative ABC transport system permease protein